jgi:hypothetical protein
MTFVGFSKHKNRDPNKRTLLVAIHPFTVYQTIISFFKRSRQTTKFINTKKSTMQRLLSTLLLLVSILLFKEVAAFSSAPALVRRYQPQSTSAVHVFDSSRFAVPAFSSSSSTYLSTDAQSPPTVWDPSALQGLVQDNGGLLSSPFILAVPIVAALALASLLAWFIISYASPNEEDD